MFNFLPQEMIPFKEQIFQMGWFNHRLDKGTSVNTLLSGHASILYLKCIALQGPIDAKSDEILKPKIVTIIVGLLKNDSFSLERT